MNTFAACLAIALAGSPVAAFTQSCVTIQDDKERLACYDSAAKPPARTDASQSAGIRAGYAHELRKVFLSTGYDIAVFSQEKQEAGTSGKWPQLIIFGYLSNPLVYQMITKGGVLKNAQEFGFKMVQFSSKGSNGVWYFDISKPTLPRCDDGKRVCI